MLNALAREARLARRRAPSSNGLQENSSPSEGGDRPVRRLRMPLVEKPSTSASKTAMYSRGRPATRAWSLPLKRVEAPTRAIMMVTSPFRIVSLSSSQALVRESTVSTEVYSRNPIAIHLVEKLLASANLNERGTSASPMSAKIAETKNVSKFAIRSWKSMMRSRQFPRPISRKESPISIPESPSAFLGILTGVGFNR